MSKLLSSDFHIRDDFPAGAPVCAVGPTWYNAVAKFLNDLEGTDGVDLMKILGGRSKISLDWEFILDVLDKVRNLAVLVRDPPSSGHTLPEKVIGFEENATKATLMDPPEGGGTPSDQNPKASQASASPGTSEEYSRGDHVHPVCAAVINARLVADGAATSAAQAIVDAAAAQVSANAANNRLDDVDQEITSITSDIAAIDASVKSNTAAIAAHDAQIETISASLQQLIDIQIAQIDSEIEQLQNDVTQAQSDATSAKSTATDAQTRIGAVEEDYLKAEDLDDVPTFDGSGISGFAIVKMDAAGDIAKLIDVPSAAPSENVFLAFKKDGSFGWVSGGGGDVKSVSVNGGSKSTPDASGNVDISALTRALAEQLFASKATEGVASGAAAAAEDAGILAASASETAGAALSQVQSQAQALAALQATVSGHTSGIASLNAEVDTLNTSLQQLIDIQIAQIDSAIEQLQTSVSQAQSDASDAQTRVGTIEADYLTSDDLDDLITKDEIPQDFISAISSRKSGTIKVCTGVTWNGTKLAYTYRNVVVTQGLITNITASDSTTDIDTPTVITWS